MAFNGRVHAKYNICVRNDTTKFDSFLTMVGNVYRYLKRDPSTRGSNPQIKDAGRNHQTLNFDHEYDYDFTNAWSADDWKNAALSAFGGRVQDGAMALQEIISPIPEVLYDPNNPDVSSHLMIEKGVPSDTAEFQAARLYYEADLIIEDTQGKDKSGNDVSLAPCGATSIENFYDPREKKNMVVTEVDIGAFEACGKMAANEIQYVSRNAANGAVRLVNGSQLPSQGLTVVSENPVYVQGDYNTVNKVPAAVLGDAITVLSNNWEPNDSNKKGKDVTSERPATETTVNTAFALAPSAESTVGQGNGQLENRIRFLENWNGVDFNYNGSLDALWYSQQAAEPLRCSGDSGDNYYRPPIRNWAYDTLFDTNPPPGTRWRL